MSDEIARLAPFYGEIDVHEAHDRGPYTLVAGRVKFTVHRVLGFVGIFQGLECLWWTTGEVSEVQRLLEAAEAVTRKLEKRGPCHAISEGEKPGQGPDDISHT